MIIAAADLLKRNPQPTEAEVRSALAGNLCRCGSHNRIIRAVTAAAPLPAISCLGAFRPPAARARGEVRHCRQPKTCTIGDIDPRYSINSLASASKLGGNAIPSAFAVLEIDNNLKSHVQQRPPGVIFRLEVLGLLPAQLTHSRTAATC
jgi:hypothetical protein